MSSPKRSWLATGCLLLCPAYMAMSLALSATQEPEDRRDESAPRNNIPIYMGNEHICCEGSLTASSRLWAPPVHRLRPDACGNRTVLARPGTGFDNDYCTRGWGMPDDPPCDDGDCTEGASWRRFNAHRIVVPSDDTDLVISTCGYTPSEPFTQVCPGSFGAICPTAPIRPPVDLYLYREAMLCGMPCQNLVAYDRAGTIMSTCRSVNVGLDRGTYILVVSERVSEPGQGLQASPAEIAYAISLSSARQNGVEITCRGRAACSRERAVDYRGGTFTAGDTPMTSRIYLAADLYPSYRGPKRGQGSGDQP